MKFEKNLQKRDLFRSFDRIQQFGWLTLETGHVFEEFFCQNSLIPP